MESNQQPKEGFFNKMLRKFSKKVLNLIDLNIDGKVFQEQETFHLSLNDCPSINSSSTNNQQDQKMTRQDYLNSINETSNCPNKTQANLTNSIYQHNKEMSANNHMPTVSHNQDNIIERRRSTTSSFNSAFRALNSNRNDRPSTRETHQGTSSLIKRQRDDIEAIPPSKKPKLEEKDKNRSNSIVVEDASMRSYQSYLSKQSNPTPVMDNKFNRISNQNIKSLDEIKKEMEIKRKEAEKKIEDVRQKTVPHQNSKQSYEEKKQLLIDYYNEKAKVLKEETMKAERERMKRESNFNQLKLSRNELISIKGKEKAKPKEEIIKQAGLFYDKTDKPKINSTSINSFKPQEPLIQQEEKKEIYAGLARTISFGVDNNSLADSVKNNLGGIDSLFSFKEKGKEEQSQPPKEDNILGTSLFFNDSFDNPNKITFKPDPSKVGESSFIKPINDNHGTPNLLNKQPDNKDNKEKDVKEKNPSSSNSSSTLFPFLTETTFKDKPSTGINSNLDKSKPPETSSLFDKVTPAAGLFISGTLINQDTKSPMKSNEASIFKSNTTFNNTTENAPNSNLSLFTPQPNNLSKEEQIKKVLESNEPSQGSLLTSSNPFINTKKTEMANVFQSPAKQKEQPGIFAQPDQPINPTGSLFSANKASLPHLNTSSSLFTPNNFSNPVTKAEPIHF